MKSDKSIQKNCKALAAGLLILLLVECLGVAVWCVTPFSNEWGYRDKSAQFCPGIDFILRMNEIKLIRRGVDPYDVWMQNVRIPGYCAAFKEKAREHEAEPVNAYTPWEYAFLMPLTFLDVDTAWVVYFLTMVVGLVVLFASGYNSLKIKNENSYVRVVTAALPLVVLIYPIWSNFRVGNFAIHSLAALALMAVCLNRGRDAIAGLCWAVAMLKPQLAVLVAVPLLIRRKFLTCFVASGVCLIASVGPAVLCGKNIPVMVKQSILGSTFAFHGCGTWPTFCCSGTAGDMWIAVLIGFIVCVYSTWMLRNEEDWSRFIMPATICALCWSWSNHYSFVFGWMALHFVLTSSKATTFPNWRMFLPMAIVLSCLAVAIPVIGSFFIPGFSYENVQHHVKSLNTSAILLLSIFCVYREFRHSICEQALHKL